MGTAGKPPVTARLLAFHLCAAAAAALIGVATAHAGAGPFGVATPDSQSGLADAGPFTGIVYWAMQMQSVFYRQLTAALSAFSGGSSTSVWLVALSFAYGIFHAVGPGHGKAVISSYLVATGDSRGRGVALAFTAGLVQALSAIAIVSVASIVLSVTAVTMARWTDGVEIASCGLIAALGLAVLVRKGRDALRLMRVAPRHCQRLFLPGDALRCHTYYRPGCRLSPRSAGRPQGCRSRPLSRRSA